MRTRPLLAVLAFCVLAGGACGAITWRAHLQQEALRESLLIEAIRRVTAQCIPQADRNPVVRDGEVVMSERFCACAAEPVARAITGNMVATLGAGTPEAMVATGSLPDRAEDVTPDIWACYDGISPEEVARRVSRPSGRRS